jgi:hypothetical protein
MTHYANRADRMPHWPARMNADLAALYLGVSLPTLKERAKAGQLPAPVHDGGRVFWSKQQLDDFVDAQFGNAKRKNTWD